MESEEIKQLEIKLSNAVSYDERSAIRTRLRVLRKELNSGKSAATTSLPIQTRTEVESTLRPKSAVLTNGYGSNSHAPLENTQNRKSLIDSPTPNSNVRSSKSIHFPRDSNSIENDRFSVDSNTSKRHSYQPTLNAKAKISSKTPPVKRKETTDTVETRGRSKTVDSATNNDIGPEAIIIQTLTKQQIQFCLTEYLNRELKPNRKIVPTGESLYLVCADPRILCRLVNVSKKNTIDMRCLTEISDTASDIQIKIAVEENMTLAVESARSIGCHITEEDVLKIIHHDQETIHKILLRILRARVIDFGGMEDMPSSYFSEPSFIFEQLSLSIPTDSNEVIPATDTTQSVSGKLATTSDKKTPDAKKSSPVTSSRDNIQRNSDPIKIRRVCSDLPPDVKERPQITKSKQSSDVRGLAASFEKNRVEPISRQMSGDSPRKMESVQIESKTTPANLRRHHKDVIVTKSSDNLSKKSAPLFEEENQVPSPEKQTGPPAVVDTSSEVTKPPSPNKYSSHQAQTESAYRSPLRAKKSESKDDVLDSVFIPKFEDKYTHPYKSAVTESDTADTTAPPAPVIQDIIPPTPQEPVLAPLPQEPVPVSLPQESPPPTLTMDLSKLITDSPTNSPLNSSDNTPVATAENTKESDEYLLTLQDTDPTLTYEQRKRIRQLKRMRKQNLNKK